MLKDLYFRGETDPNFTPDVLETSSELEALVYQIKMIIMTNKTEVLGEKDFGANQEDLLFTTSNMLGSMITKNMVDQINQYSELARAYNIDLDAKRIKDPDNPNRDIMFLDIKINGKSAFGIIL